jgi:hypothetical protein
MSAFRWLPGKGWAVVTAGFAAWLPAPADAELLDRLFVLGSESRFLEVGELLGRSAPASALLLLAPQPRVQNRGGVPLRAWDVAGLDLPADRLASAVGIQLGAGDGAGLPITAGVVACGAVRWVAEVAPASGRGPVADAPVAGPPEVRTGPAATPPGFIAEVPDWVASASPNPFAELWGHTIRRPVEAAAVRVVRDSDVEPEPAPTGGAEPPSSPAAAETVPPPAVPEPVAPVGRRPFDPATATLIADLSDGEELGPEADHGEVIASDGRRLPILGTVVVGRAPRPLPGEDAQLLRVASPGRSISRSHAVIAVIDGVVRARDLGSNNGTTLVRSGRSQTLATDAWTPLASGDVLDLGENVTVRLEGLT